jgi:hypothetical protein
LTQSCHPLITQFDPTFGHLFTANNETDNYKAAKRYLQENLAILAQPSDPSGYLYFICQAIAIERKAVDDLTTELIWLRNLNLP